MTGGLDEQRLSLVGRDYSDQLPGDAVAIPLTYIARIPQVEVAALPGPQRNSPRRGLIL
jgi:hypothetical protein